MEMKYKRKSQRIKRNSN